MNRKMRRAEGRDLDCHARFPARPPQAGAKFGFDLRRLSARRSGRRRSDVSKRGNWRMLLRYTTALLRLIPASLKAHNNCGAALAGLERFEDAVAAYRRAIALKPDYADAFNNLGNALCEIGKLDEAERALRQAVELRPRWAQCHTNLGLVYKHQARFADAEMAHREAIATGPGLADAYNNLGEISFCCLGRLEDAEEGICAHAIVLNEHYARGLRQLGNDISRRKADWMRQRQPGRQAIALKPRFACAYNALGNVLLFDFGRFQFAEEAFRTAISLRPHFAEAFSNLTRQRAEENKTGWTRSGECISAGDRVQERYCPNALQSWQLRSAGRAGQVRGSGAGLSPRDRAFKPDFSDAHNNLGA